MKKILGIVVGLVVVGAVWYFVSPLFLNKTVDEDLPTLEELEQMSDEQKALIQDDMMKSAAQMPPIVVNEDMPDMPTGEQVLLPGEGDADEPETPEPTGPTQLAQGEFRGADLFHQGSGTASVYTLSDNSTIVRFENFSVTNGPDLRVLLATGKNPSDSDSLGEYIELGELKGNQGNQNYTVPDGVDVSLYNSVVIYCKPFHVVFAVATLSE